MMRRGCIRGCSGDAFASLKIRRKLTFFERGDARDAFCMSQNAIWENGSYDTDDIMP